MPEAENIDDMSKYVPLVPKVEVGAQDAVISGTLGDYTELVLGPDSEHPDKIMPATSLRELIPYFDDYKELLFKGNGPEFGKARVTKNKKGQLERVAMIPPIDNKARELLSAMLGKESSMKGQKKDALLHLLQHIPLVILDYKTKTIRVESIGKGEPVVIAMSEHDDQAQTEFSPGEILKAGRPPLPSGLEGTAKGKIYGVYSVIDDYLYSHIKPAENGKDTFIEVMSSGTMRDATSSNTIKLESALRIDDLKYLMSATEMLLTKVKNSAMVDTKTLLPAAYLHARVKTGSSYETVDGEELPS